MSHKCECVEKLLGRIIDAIDGEIASSIQDEYIDGLERAKELVISLDRRA